MKSARRSRFSTTTVIHTLHNDHSTPIPHSNSTEIPITATATAPAHFPQSQSVAATKIQSTYRSHLTRTLIKKIKTINSESTRLQRLIQRQDTVDAVRTNNLERIKLNEALMRLLLTLDSVPGYDPNVREVRRRVSRRIIGLQEILDGVCEAQVKDWDGYLKEWDDAVEGMEEEVCRERGGDEFERFCAENLGFRCLQRFLRQ